MNFPFPRNPIAKHEGYSSSVPSVDEDELSKTSLDTSEEQIEPESWKPHFETLHEVVDDVVNPGAGSGSQSTFKAKLSTQVPEEARNLSREFESVASDRATVDAINAKKLDDILTRYESLHKTDARSGVSATASLGNRTSASPQTLPNFAMSYANSLQGSRVPSKADAPSNSENSSSDSKPLNEDTSPRFPWISKTAKATDSVDPRKVNLHANVVQENQTGNSFNNINVTGPIHTIPSLSEALSSLNAGKQLQRSTSMVKESPSSGSGHPSPSSTGIGRGNQGSEAALSPNQNQANASQQSASTTSAPINNDNDIEKLRVREVYVSGLQTQKNLITQWRNLLQQVQNVELTEKFRALQKQKDTIREEEKLLEAKRREFDVMFAALSQRELELSAENERVCQKLHEPSIKEQEAKLEERGKIIEERIEEMQRLYDTIEERRSRLRQKEAELDYRERQLAFRETETNRKAREMESNVRERQLAVDRREHQATTWMRSLDVRERDIQRREDQVKIQVNDMNNRELRLKNSSTTSALEKAQELYTTWEQLGLFKKDVEELDRDSISDDDDVASFKDFEESVEKCDDTNTRTRSDSSQACDIETEEKKW